MFAMFVDSPPVSTPVNLVYFEKRPFGPFGKAAGELSTETGFLGDPLAASGTECAGDIPDATRHLQRDRARSRPAAGLSGQRHDGAARRGARSRPARDAGGPAQNYLDPVTLFSVLAAGKLSDGKDAIDARQKQNSWLDNVTKSRVLITFRDEWNAALLSPAHDAIIAGPSAGQFVVARLDTVHAGTVVTPSGWNHYTCSIGVPSQRKLTPVPSAQAAADPLTIDATAPAHRVIATVRPEAWFHPTEPPITAMPGFDLHLYTQGNIVTPLIDGLPAFDQLVRDLRELDDSSPPSGRFPDNFVLLAGWFMDLNFQLIPGDPDSTVKKLLTRGVRSNHKLIVRGLVWWKNDFAAVPTIVGLDGTDHYTEAWAVDFPPLNDVISFHWKCTVVRNRNGTFASLGGIDINPNRLDGPDHKPGGKRYHDVHCRIQGPAVADVTEAFLARWDIHGIGSEVTDSITPTVSTPPGVPATHMVQIARTFRAGTGAGFQRWSPNGERTIWATLQRAIDRAKRYIYIEGSTSSPKCSAMPCLPRSPSRIRRWTS